MEKPDYKRLMNEKPWQWAKDRFDRIDTYVPTKVAKLDIDPEAWIKFSVDNFDLAHPTHEVPKPHYDEFSNKMANLNVEMGMNINNSFALLYGVDLETNQKMIEMFGESNRKLLNLRPDYLFLKLIVKMPGHSSAWHVDDLGRYTERFKDELQIDKDTQMCQHGQIVRSWFPVTDWDNGHTFQISKSIITNWQAGDVYNIPFGMGHCSSNAGYVPQLTVSLTGIVHNH